MLTVHPTLLIGPSDWQPARIPREEFARRVAALWREFPGASRAIVYGDSRHHAELAYLTNLVPKLEPAVALLSRTGEPELRIGGGPNMLGASRPLTFITELLPLRGGQPIGEWAAADQAGWPDSTVMIGGGYMPMALRQGILAAMGDAGPPVEATARLWTLMQRKSSYELLAVRETCVILAAAMAAIRHARDAGLTAAILAGERAANARGAQDVRTLFSIDGGRTLQPFVTPNEALIDPLQVYVAVRRFNYWAEGFAQFSDRRHAGREKAAELLKMALSTVRAGNSAADLASYMDAAIRPYRLHPVTAGALVSRIGLALDEPPHTDIGPTFEAGNVYSLRVGVTDDADRHAIVSAMLAVREAGNDMLWSG